MTQTDFVQSLLTPGASPPGLIDPQGRPAGARFDVYRNNVVAGLVRAMEQAFPVIRRLVGPEFFAAMSAGFVRAHPPRSRLMMTYGADFPAFLADFPPVAHLPYLPDVARLEQALRESYHAADATADPALVTLPPERLLAARLILAPALRVLRSDWPIHSIWLGAPIARMQAEAVLILRPDFDPEPHKINAEAARFIAALQSGRPLAEAVEEGGAGHDAATTLALLISGGGIITFQEDIA